VRYALTTTKTGAVHGIKGQLTVENFLTAQVDRATGQVSIRNTDTTVGTGVAVTGYQIGSAGGALKPATFTSAFGGGTWQSANLTANSIGELNPTSSSTVGLSGSNSVGTVYDPVSLETTFGTTPVSDLTFSYTRSDGRTVNAPVTYVNNGLANTLVLQVDPTDGKAKIVNDSVFNNIKLDGYQVTSASGSLLASWNSLQDQSVTGWQEAAPTTTSLGELNPSTSSTLNAGQTLATMTGLFKTVGGTQDLAFQFRVPGTGAGTGVINGVVRYAAFGGALVGDYNNDGTVDAADYTLWRSKLGTSFALANRDPLNSGNVSAADYNSWKADFGAHSGSGAAASSPVPEPSSLLLLTSGGIAIFVGRQRRR
jgi:hypothetical protein